MDRNSIKVFICLFILSIFNTQIHAQSNAQLFKNRISDLPSVRVNNDNTLSWFNYKSGDLNLVTERFGNLGDHLALAAYDANGLDIGVIGQNGFWVITGELEIHPLVFQFGDNDSLFLAGGDFNNNNFADAAHATRLCSRKRSKFEVMFDPLVDQSNLLSLRAGKGHDHKTFLDIDGNGSDEICYAKAIKSNGRFSKRFKLICRDVLSKKKLRSISLGKIFSTPLRLKNATGPDHLVLVKQNNNSTKIKVKSVSGNTVYKTKLNNTGDLVIGDFLNTGTEQIILINNNAQGIHIDITTGQQSMINNLGGIFFDSTNINYFKNSENSKCFCDTKKIRKNGSCGSQSTNNNTDSSTDVGNGTNPTVNGPQAFGSDGSLWKPVSDTNRPGFQGNPVVLFSGKFKRQFDSCSVPLKNGGRHELTCVKDQFSQIPFTCFTNPLADGLARQTWRFNVSCHEIAKVEVSCKDQNQTVVFTVPASQQASVCSRFG